ncbi:hypothetical protein BJV82DRAFT_667490 [Fennellomyces sp. T-0311]|nr:hypothetical protein BJV82DRAFT_667490 [Fennellomyces sp. T-0311]
MADKQSSHAHHAPSATVHHKKPSHPATAVTTTKPVVQQQVTSPALAIPASMSNVFVVPSNMPVSSDPYFGRPHPPIDTSTNVAAAQQPSNVGTVVGAVIGGAIGLVAIVIVALIFIRRRKRRRNEDGRPFQHYYIREDKSSDKSGNNSSNSTLRPPPAYTPHSQKRLTADTLVDQRASMSTMNSNYSSRNQQYTPQLAYKQQQQKQEDYSADLLGVSPSNTLIDTTAISVEDEKSRRQRVPSYQPQVIVMTEPAEEGANINTTNCYDYLYQSSYQEEHVHQKREGDHRSA